MARLIEHTHGRSWEEVIRKTFARVVGAYSCGIITPTELLAMRDPYGFRPLCIGFIPLPGQPAHIVASETCALDTVNATFVREVQPGEMVVMDEHGVHNLTFQTSSKHAMCVFEFIYFARPDSILKNCELEEARIRMGHELAGEAPVDADMVIAFPDSGTTAAIGATKELIAAGRTVEEVRKHIGADSLAYLPIPGLIRPIGRATAEQFCRPCSDGSYPVPVPKQLEMDKMQFEPQLIPDPILLDTKG